MTVPNENRKLLLSDLRNRAGLTQNALARHLEEILDEPVHSNRISNWERGLHQPLMNPEQMLKLCHLLHCSLEELVEAFRNSKRQPRNTRYAHEQN